MGMDLQFNLIDQQATLDNAAIPFRAETPPPPYRPPMPNPIHWDNSLDPTTWMPQMQRNAALLASTGAVEPPWPPNTSDPNVLHAEMIERIEALDRAIADLREQLSLS